MDEKAYQERNASQMPAIELLQAMGYIYISPADCHKQRGSRYHVLLKDILRGAASQAEPIFLRRYGKRILRRQY